jgi:hypothetical protein
MNLIEKIVRRFFSKAKSRKRSESESYIQQCERLVRRLKANAKAMQKEVRLKKARGEYKSKREHRFAQGLADYRRDLAFRHSIQLQCMRANELRNDVGL